MESYRDKLVRWCAREGALPIDYDPAVLERIGRAAVHASLALPRGGLEIGGLLLGRHEEGRVVVTDATPFECEHAFGPSFLLSQQDETRLGEMIALAKFSGDTEPVGWYHSHTRSEILLSAADQGLHRRHFPEPWQIALVVRPASAASVRAGFFFWETSGSDHPEAKEFHFDLTTKEADHSIIEAVTPSVSDSAPDSRSCDGPVGNQELPVERVETADEPLVEPVEAAGDQESPAAPISESGLRDDEGISTGRFPTELNLHRATRAGRLTRHWLLALTACSLVSAVAAGYATRRIWVDRSTSGPPVDVAGAKTASIRLVTIDDEGQLQILWDPSQPVVLRSSGASLEIKDGNESRSFTVSPAQLQTGSFTYGRQSERVDVTLSISRPEGGNLVQVTTYVGKPPKSTSANTRVQPERDKLAEEVVQLRNALARASERTKKLERLVEILRKTPIERSPKTVADPGPPAAKQP